ncbi:MAG: hypothetical protein K6U14_09630 [Firmicutes bacterium]|nr:hypothetical protein [Alicyclobacillaceae bacterium]MCL6497873.1 hypothetical protein [Bacillota bacterium]
MIAGPAGQGPDGLLADGQLVGLGAVIATMLEHGTAYRLAAVVIVKNGRS